MAIMTKGREPGKEPRESACRSSERDDAISTLKLLGASTVVVAGLFVSMLFGMHSCDESNKRYWRSQTPMCEGPRSYKLRSGTYSAKYGFSTEREFTLKKGETLKAEGKSYVVVGHASGSKEGTLVLQEKDGENFALIHSSDSGPSRFYGMFRFDGWVCEKPLAAKPE